MSDEFDTAAPLSGAPKKEDQISPANPLKLGIVGHGFVGKAVSYAFFSPSVDIFIADPKYNTTIDDLIEFDPQVSFICAPTPMNPETGFVDASIVEDAVIKLIEHTESLVVVKSTITPDIIDRLYNSMFEDGHERFVYNPEFLTEKAAEEQFVNAEFHVLGGYPNPTGAIAELYDVFSLCRSKEFFRMSAPEASFVKYAINSYLATKLIFFNQLYDLINYNACSYNIITRVVGEDPRVGIGHTRVPGYDGKRGYGGACLPKDIMAFLKFSEVKNEETGEVASFSLLEKVIEINNKYRAEYETDDREKANNITFGEKDVNNGQIEEEQQTEDDGSTVGE